MNAKPAGEPWTVQRLKSIKPGERVCYYRGDFAIDIRQAQTATKGCPDGVPKYAALLNSIRNAARELERSGRVKLSEARVGMSVRNQTFDDRSVTITMTEYTATAC
jgi:hypothetical protein